MARHSTIRFCSAISLEALLLGLGVLLYDEAATLGGVAISCTRSVSSASCSRLCDVWDASLNAAWQAAAPYGLQEISGNIWSRQVLQVTQELGIFPVPSSLLLHLFLVRCNLSLYKLCIDFIVFIMLRWADYNIFNFNLALYRDLLSLD